jgi:hypothetical protein
MSMVRAEAFEAPSSGIFTGGSYGNRPRVNVVIDRVGADQLACPLIDRHGGASGALVSREDRGRDDISTFDPAFH